MPETNGNENPVSQSERKKRNERAEAKFFEDAKKMIAEADRLAMTRATLDNIIRLDANSLLNLYSGLLSLLQIRHSRMTL